MGNAIRPWPMDTQKLRLLNIVTSIRFTRTQMDPSVAESKNMAVSYPQLLSNQNQAWLVKKIIAKSSKLLVESLNQSNSYQKKKK